MSKCSRDCECNDERKKCSKCSCNDCKSDSCSCSHPKVIKLHRKDRERLTHIAQEIRRVATQMEAIERISENIKALSGSLGSISDGQAAQTTQLSSISHALNQYTVEQKSQASELRNISSSINSIPSAIASITIPPVNLEIPGEISQSIREISRSIERTSITQDNISNSTRYLLPALLLLSGAVILTPFISGFLSSVTPPAVCQEPCPPSPPPASPPSPSPSPVTITIVNQITPSIHTHCLSNHKCLNVRKSPSLSGDVVLRITCNSPEVQVTGATAEGDGEIWAHITYQSSGGQPISGWVVRRFLSL